MEKNRWVLALYGLVLVAVTDVLAEPAADSAGFSDLVGGTSGPPDSSVPATAKVGHRLSMLAREYDAFLSRQGFKAAGVFKPADPALSVSDGHVTIDAAAEGNAQALRVELEALGLQHGAVFGRTVSGRLPIAAIGRLDGLGSLRFARPTLAVTQVGSVTSQGDRALHADDARSISGVDGTGITVGVLSDSYDCLGGAATGVLQGDLPSGINVLDDTVCSGTSDEGRGMMELIHDVAPGTALAFHTAANGQANFAQGIVELASAPVGAQVIVDDLVYVNEPFFQDGIVAQAVDQVVAAGVTYVSAAGNGGRRSYQSPFRSSGIFRHYGRGNCLLHDFDTGPGVDAFQRVSFPAGSASVILFQWDQPFFSVSGAPGAASDLDMLLTDVGHTVVLPIGIEPNIGGDPFEGVRIQNRGATAVEADMMIAKCGGPRPSLLKYIVLGTMGIVEFPTPSATAFGHANARGAIAVGAAAYRKTPAFGTRPPVIERYSSAGRVPIIMDTSGNRLPSRELRQKPEIVAPDRADTSFFPPGPGTDFDRDGFPNFAGTSAAAAHAAGLAALVLEQGAKSVPAPTPAQTRAFLQHTTVDMDDGRTPQFDRGFDSRTGFGLAQADAAVAASGLADLAVVAVSAPDAVAVSEKFSYTVTVTNNGPALASGVTLADVLPVNVTLVSMSPKAKCGGRGTVTCNLGQLPVGASATVTLNVISAMAGIITNTATTTADQTDPNLSDNTASVAIDAGPRATPVFCRESPATIVGTRFRDTLIGTSGDDVIWAGPGNDVVDGGGGNDVICGGNGNDTLAGGDGDDTIAGGPGTDKADGGPGTDVCFAERRTDC